MTEPKLLTILKALSDRLKVINGADPYHTAIGSTVIRGKRLFNFDELPAIACYLTPRGVEETSSGGDQQKINAQLVVEAHHPVGDHPEDTAIYMLADIQTAMELEDDTVGATVLGRVQFAGDAIHYPEDSGKYVTAQVAYDINHIRTYADPT